MAKPTYEQVSAGGTGHVEAVQVVYDPAVVTYDALVEHFWRTIDPFNARGQFCDIGESYRPVIFVADEQPADCRRRSRAIGMQKQFKERIVVEIAAAPRSIAPRSTTRTTTRRIPSATVSIAGTAAATAAWRAVWGEH